MFLHSQTSFLDKINTTSKITGQSYLSFVFMCRFLNILPPFCGKVRQTDRLTDHLHWDQGAFVAEAQEIVTLNSIAYSYTRITNKCFLHRFNT